VGKKRVLHISQDQAWQLTKHVSNHEAHYFKEISSGVGLLYLAHFDINPDEFELFIDKTFAQIKQQNIETLIIDIRDNPGGNTDTVTYLSRHLASKPFRLVSSVREKLHRENRGILNYKGSVGEILNDDWEEWENPVRKHRFTGKTYLLISPVSYSAAIVLATTLKDNGMATLVGETTGGFANQTAQGNLFNLPHSQLRAYIATRMLVRPNGNLARQGVVPDHQVYNSVIDIQAQRDVVLDFILTRENIIDE
jgi:C-terminal processing protease CtpA/Prc